MKYSQKILYIASILAYLTRWNNSIKEVEKSNSLKKDNNTLVLDDSESKKT